MEFLLENILNLVGFLVGLGIGIMSFVGFRNTGSPTLFRLTIAFFSISIGFFVIWSGYMLEDYVIKSGDRIAQMILERINRFFLISEIEEHTQTERGDGGFGSTGN